MAGSIPFLPDDLDVSEIVRSAIQFGVKRWSTEAFRTLTTDYDRKADRVEVIEAQAVSVAPPTPPARQEGLECPACAIDNEVIRARGRIEAFVLNAERHGGAISPEMPATLYLARQYLSSARAQTIAIRARVPAMAEHCDRLVGCLDACDQAVPDPRAVTADACQAAIPLFVAAQAESTEFVVAYERLVKRANQSDRLRQVAQRHGVQDPDAFYRDFREEMNHG